MNPKSIRGGWLRLPVAMILILAALLKTYQLATSPAEANYVLDSRWLTIALIEFELALGFWLGSGIWARGSRATALATFSLFAFASLYKALSGETDCGCFGSVHVHPWITFAIDSVMVAWLAYWKPVSSDWPLRQPALKAVFPVGGALAMVAVLIPILNFQTREISDAGKIIGSGSIVVLEPENWIGKRLPVADYIENAESLMSGAWQVIFYHEDCPQCQQLIDKALRQVPHLPTAFVEVPPLQSPQRAEQSKLIWLRLDDTHEWFVEAPATVMLEDGLVKKFISRNEIP